MKRSLTHIRALHGAAQVVALNVLHLTADVPDGDWVSIGGRAYECDDQHAEAIVAGNVRVPVFRGFANGTLNFDDAQNVVDGNTVTLGPKVYTFKATLTNVDGYVQIGPTLDRSIYNLVAAINVGYPDLIDPPAAYGDKNDIGEGAGAAYAAATTPNPANVNAIHGGDFELLVSHVPGGAAGNSVAVGASLVGTGSWVEEAFLDPVPHPTGDQFATALVAALNRDPLGPVYAEKLSSTEVLVWSRRPGDVRLPCNAAFSEGGNAWQAATLGGGVVAREGLVPMVGAARVVTVAEAAQQRLHFVFGFEPSGALLQVRTGVGAAVTFDGGVALSGKRATVTAATVPIAAGQVFNLMVFK